MSSVLTGASDASAENQQDIEDKVDTIDTNLDTLVLRAQAQAGSNATTIICTDLADYGDNYFNTGWWAYILQDDGGAGAAPEGEWRKITDYDSATGTFTVDAFSAAVATDDYFMIVKDEFIVKSPEHQTPATLNQAAPVQNTWYTVLDTDEPGILRRVGLSVQTTQEDIELEITLDGVLYVDAAAGVAGTRYEGYPYIEDSALSNLVAFTSSTAVSGLNWAYKTLLVRVRKTSANGAGNLTAWVIYETLKP